MEGITWPGEDRPAERGPELPLTPRKLLEPLPHTERDLGPVRGDRAGGVGTDLHGLVIGERQREEDAGVGDDETASDDLERDVRWEAGGAAERLD